MFVNWSSLLRPIKQFLNLCYDLLSGLLKWFWREALRLIYAINTIHFLDELFIIFCNLWYFLSLLMLFKYWIYMTFCYQTKINFSINSYYIVSGQFGIGDVCCASSCYCSRKEFPKVKDKKSSCYVWSLLAGNYAKVQRLKVIIHCLVSVWRRYVEVKVKSDYALFGQCTGFKGENLLCIVWSLSEGDMHNPLLHEFKFFLIYFYAPTTKSLGRICFICFYMSVLLSCKFWQDNTKNAWTNYIETVGKVYISIVRSSL